MKEVYYYKTGRTYTQDDCTIIPPSNLWWVLDELIENAQYGDDDRIDVLKTIGVELDQDGKVDDKVRDSFGDRSDGVMIMKKNFKITLEDM